MNKDIRDEFFKIRNGEEWNQFTAKYPDIKIRDLDNEMREHMNVIMLSAANKERLKNPNIHYEVFQGDEMNNFKKIYEILKILEKSMDLQEFDSKGISKERLELQEARWSRIMAMLVNEEYIKGVETQSSMDCEYPQVRLVRPKITLKGLEYLEQNSLMKKAANMAKGIVDVIS